MSPEAPGNLVVLDLRFERGGLHARVHEYVPSTDARFPTVYWSTVPEGGIPIDNGVAYLVAEPPYKESAGGEAKIDEVGEATYVWDYVARGDGLMIIMMLPLGYTVGSAVPRPKRFFDRLVAYWMPPGTNGQRVTITWELRYLNRDVTQEIRRMNREGLREPSNAGVKVNATGPR